MNTADKLERLRSVRRRIEEALVVLEGSIDALEAELEAEQ